MFRNVKPSAPARKRGFLAVAFALCLAAVAPAAFGQSACPQPASAPATDPVHTIIPVHLDASTGNITVGSTTYCGQNPGFHLLALQRQPDTRHLDAPDLILDQTYTDAAGVNNALKQIQTTSGGPLVIINAVGNYGIALNTVAQALTPFGAYPGLEVINAAIPFIFIGNAGRNPQTALQRGYSTRNVDGYLAQDSNSNYAFTQTEFVHYDITTDGTIKVGNKTYDVASSYKPGCSGDASNSFHLVIVDREAPDTLIGHNTYCTAQSNVEIQRLIGDINTLTASVSNEGVLVFLASNGHPIPADWNFGTDGDARLYPLAQQIANLGGYWETMVYLTPNDTYSLVGAPPPPAGIANPRQRAKESSSVYPVNVNGLAPTGELHGVLARGRGNWYSPLNADPTGLANLDLYAILAQPPAAYPSFAGDQLTAFQYINQALCNGENCLRNSYGNLNLDLGVTYTQLSNLPDSNNNDCRNSNADPVFCQIRAQLLPEVKNAANIHAFYGNVNGLWSSSGTVTIYQQLSAYNNVKATLPAPPTAPAPSLAGPLVNLFLGLASNAPVVGPAFGLADLFFNFASSLATDPQGNQTIDLTSTIAKLEDQASDQFTAQGNATGTLFKLVTEDGGKLNTLGTDLASATGPGSPWYWSTTTTAQLLQATKPAIQQAAYQNIMPAAYAIGSYVPNTPVENGWGWGKLPLTGQPYAYVAEAFYNAPYTPISHPFWTPAYSVYSNPTDYATSGFANQPGTGTILADGAWLAISLQTTPANGGSQDFQYQPPNQTLLATLFQPVSQSGLGVYRPAFFEGWPFPRVTCTASFGIYPPGQPGMSVGGCNWSAAQSVTAPLPPGPSVTSITMQAAQIASNGNEVDVRLTLFNNGTVAANSIDLTSIALRTLAGSGQATVLSPAAPMQIGSLVPGDSADVILKLNVPPGITKLAITEAGSVDLGQPQLVQLSEGQVLYPQR